MIKSIAKTWFLAAGIMLSAVPMAHSHPGHGIPGHPPHGMDVIILLAGSALAYYIAVRGKRRTR